MTTPPEKPVQMSRAQLRAELAAGEWDHLECKEAWGEVPKSAYETVSAFANTHGGWLVFGVAESPQGFLITGVRDSERLARDFLTALRADNKVNHDIHATVQRHRIDDKTLLVIHIPESARHQKPIYLHGDIRRTFLRRSGADVRAGLPEIERMLRDAAEERWDGQVVDFPVEEALDLRAIAWYRRHFAQSNPGFDDSVSDTDFLYQWGYLAKRDGVLLPTRAAILVFGSAVALHQLLPRPTLDAQWIPVGLHDPLPEMRWLDRVVYEENLLTTWQGLVAKYFQSEPRPFRGIDPHTLMRDDTPPGYRVFREAAINLLIHQDYADHSRKAVIKFYRDGVQFWNPGDVFGAEADLLEPGEKEVRNPRIAAAFRRLALCEQAGTGLRMMQALWQELGYCAPVYRNDRAHKAFECLLPLDAPPVSPPHVPAVDAPTPGPSRDQDGTKTGPGWDQDGTRIELSGEQVAILRACLTPRPISELMTALKRTNRTKFREMNITPLLMQGLLAMTIPTAPSSKHQQYRTTSAGKAVLEAIPDEKEL
jgi:ATP-dependent DNA helicase RecG